MNKRLILLLALVATSSFASQNYRTNAHAWFNDEGDIEISSELISSRSSPVLLSGQRQPTTETLPAAQLFRLNSARLIAPSQSLIELAQRLQRITPPQTVVITGHTDSTGSTSHNLTLSTQRAQSIQRYLAEFAPQHRYHATGQGEAHPVASNATRQGREQNRRVTVIVQGAN